MAAATSSTTEPSAASAPAVLAHLGKRLREQRLAQSMPQAELASRAGVGLGSIKQLESTGKVTLETLVRVVQVLDLGDELQGLFALRVSAGAAAVQLAGTTPRQRARRPRSITSPAADPRAAVLQ